MGPMNLAIRIFIQNTSVSTFCWSTPVLIPYVTDLLNQLCKNMSRSSDTVLSESISKWYLIYWCLFVSIKYSIIGSDKSMFPVQQQAYQILNSVLLVCTLTHWGQDKMATILQMIFWNAFSWMKMYELWLKFQWNLCLVVQLTIL